LKDLFYGKTYYYKITACYIGGCAVSDEYTFKTNPDLTPPEIIDSYSFGFISKEGSQVAIGIVTNEPSDCKYSNDANRTYYSKSLSFDNASAINHTKAFLVEGNTNYTFYVRCADVHGNPMKEEYEINFATGNILKTPPKTQNQTQTSQSLPSKTSQANSSGIVTALNSNEQSQFNIYLSYAAFVFIAIAFAYSLSHFLKKKKLVKTKAPALKDESIEPETKTDEKQGDADSKTAPQEKQEANPPELKEVANKDVSKPGNKQESPKPEEKKE
ncbi:MAG: hypothetical protein AABY04_00155, partial [Candidatus Micrarchaeota archaeon]